MRTFRCQTRYRIGGTAPSIGTISLPIGQSAMPASLRCAQANGMPMMVIASRSGGHEVAERQPPAGEDQPDDIAEVPSGPVPISPCPRKGSRSTAAKPKGRKA